MHYLTMEETSPVKCSTPKLRWLLAFTSGSSGRLRELSTTHGGLAYRVAIELAYNFDMNADDRLLWITDMDGSWARST